MRKRTRAPAPDECPLMDGTGPLTEDHVLHITRDLGLYSLRGNDCGRSQALGLRSYRPGRTPYVPGGSSGHKPSEIRLGPPPSAHPTAQTRGKRIP